MVVFHQEDYYMGLENKKRGTYLTIMGGKFCQSVPQDTEGSLERTNKMGKTVYEMFYDQFTGTLVNISIQEDTGYGKSWTFHFVDNGKSYFIQLPYSSSNATALLKMLPNIDVTKPFTLSPSQKEEDGKKKTSLFVNQNNNTIKHAYTKENPNGLPDMEQITVKGQVVWDDSKRLAFLEKMVMSDIMPKLTGKTDDGFGVFDEEPKLSEQDDQPF